MGKDIKILVCAHKESQLPVHDYFYPIQVGAALTEGRFFATSDNTGDNISDKKSSLLRADRPLLGLEELGMRHYRTEPL